MMLGERDVPNCLVKGMKDCTGYQLQARRLRYNWVGLMDSVDIMDTMDRRKSMWQGKIA